MKTDEPELQRACRIVERHCRAIGRHCQIIFQDDSVEVAPLSWSGSSVESDLYTAVKQALHQAEHL